MLSGKQLMLLASSDGQQRMIKLVQQAITERGSHWLDYIKENYPDFAWLADLIANKTADEAIKELTAAYPIVMIAASQGGQIPAIRNFHAMIRNEIERKR